MFNKKRVVVSMTSWKERIDKIDRCIKSITSQNVIDEIILNLSIDEFPKKSADLPVFLTSGEVSDKISINYLYGNTMSFKKLIPTLKMDKYKDCIIITCDDDCVYPNGIFEEALEMYNWDRPMSFNVPSLYNWGNGRLSIYERKYFPYTLDALEEQKIWDTHNDDVAYGMLLYLNKTKYDSKELNSYYEIEQYMSESDMHNRGLYESFGDAKKMASYILDKYGIGFSRLMSGNFNVKFKEKTDKINEIVKD